MDPAAIADNVVENAVTKEEVSFKELWKEQTCVIIFLRRLELKKVNNKTSGRFYKFLYIK